MKVVLGTGLTDVAGNARPAQEEWLLPTVVMQLPNVGLITLDLTVKGLEVNGAAGAVEPDSDVTVTNTTTATDFVTQAAPDGSFAPIDWASKGQSIAGDSSAIIELIAAHLGVKMCLLVPKSKIKT